MVDMAMAGKISICQDSNLLAMVMSFVFLNAHADLCEQAFRNLNSVTVPAFVKVPKNEEEDRKMGN